MYNSAYKPFQYRAMAIYTFLEKVVVMYQKLIISRSTLKSRRSPSLAHFAYSRTTRTKKWFELVQN